MAGPPSQTIFPAAPPSTLPPVLAHLRLPISSHSLASEGCPDEAFLINQREWSWRHAV